MPRKCGGSFRILAATRKRPLSSSQSWGRTLIRAGRSRPSNRTDRQQRRQAPFFKISEPTDAPALPVTSRGTGGRSVHSMRAADPALCAHPPVGAGVFTAQIFDDAGHYLSGNRANGGPISLSKQLAK